MRYLADAHIHSTYSFDGKLNMADIAELAVDKGLKYVALTEHLDLCRQSFQDYLNSLPHYFKQVELLNEKFRDKIKILSAIEFAEPHLYQKEFERITQFQYDYILGAVHFINGKSIAFKEVKALDAVEITKQYYDQVYQAVGFGGFDAFAHFDHIRRGIGGDYSEINTIDDIMKLMVRNGITLEVNSSGIRRTGHGPFPNIKKVEQYKNAGGKRLVIGSDTHKEENLYADVQETIDMLEPLNFSLGIYERRKFIEL